MNPPIFIGSSTTKDQENIVKELKTISDVMHAISVERVEVAAYQLKNVSRTWFNPPPRATRGRLARRNVEEQDLPKVQPEGEVINATFREAIRF